MITAASLNLDSNNSHITFSGSRRTCNTIKYEFSDGDTVCLRKGDIDIDVHDVMRQLEGTLKGVVWNVDPFATLESEGVIEGVSIVFSYHNIFSCSERNTNPRIC